MISCLKFKVMTKIDFKNSSVLTVGFDTCQETKKMEKRNRSLFCEKCSLQFDKKIVYDIHKSFVYKTRNKVEIEEKTIQMKV